MAKFSDSPNIFGIKLLFDLNNFELHASILFDFVFECQNNT